MKLSEDVEVENIPLENLERGLRLEFEKRRRKEEEKEKKRSKASNRRWIEDVADDGQKGKKKNEEKEGEKSYGNRITHREAISFLKIYSNRPHSKKFTLKDVAKQLAQSLPPDCRKKYYMPVYQKVWRFNQEFKKEKFRNTVLQDQDFLDSTLFQIMNDEEVIEDCVPKERSTKEDVSNRWWKNAREIKYCYTITNGKAIEALRASSKSLSRHDIHFATRALMEPWLPQAVTKDRYLALYDKLQKLQRDMKRPGNRDKYYTKMASKRFPTEIFFQVTNMPETKGERGRKQKKNTAIVSHAKGTDSTNEHFQAGNADKNAPESVPKVALSKVDNKTFEGGVQNPVVDCVPDECHLCKKKCQDSFGFALNVRSQHRLFCNECWAKFDPEEKLTELRKCMSANHTGNQEGVVGHVANSGCTSDVLGSGSKVAHPTNTWFQSKVAHKDVASEKQNLQIENKILPTDSVADIPNVVSCVPKSAATPNECYLCNKKCRDNFGLAFHVRSQHRLYCHICWTRFDSQAKLAEHRKGKKQE